MRNFRIVEETDGNGINKYYLEEQLSKIPMFIIFGKSKKYWERILFDFDSTEQAKFALNSLSKTEKVVEEHEIK